MSISIEETHINSIMQIQKRLKKILIHYMQQIADSTDCIDLDYADDILKFLEDLKSSLNSCNQNIILLKNILKMDNSEQNSENLDTVLKNTLNIEDFLFSVSSFSELKFLNKAHYIEKNTIPNVEINAETVKTEESPIVNDVPSVDTAQTDCNNELEENTLIISETKGKVFLPYNISELIKMQEANPNEYSNITEVIEKNYTLPFELFKNFPIARFRESFKLVKNVEKKSIKDAFNLGMELLFNYNLHPAIIAACKSLDELDIYLDYLETGETDKFQIFNIKFEIPPKLVK